MDASSSLEAIICDKLSETEQKAAAFEALTSNIDAQQELFNHNSVSKVILIQLTTVWPDSLVREFFRPSDRVLQ